ncbi:hypothetical protein [Cognatishimia sp.]|uniref:hypothetical protein n=1 Tax=Cognatishimia sp. TaxID=2211648 RepID=UPI003512C092
MRRYLPLCLAIGLSGCFGDAKTPLSSADIQQAIQDSTFRYHARYRASDIGGRVTFHADGQLEVKPNAGPRETGSWTIADDRVCVKVKGLRNGTESCSSISVSEDGVYHASYGITVTPFVSTQVESSAEAASK